MQARPTRTRAEHLFLLMSYITLAVASACLVWSEVGLLNETIFFGMAVGVLLVAAYLMEGRWALSARNANRLGTIIGLLALLSAARQAVQPPTDGPLTSMPWPTSMVPLLGPLLLVLLAVKLLRPKAIADHWWLQIIGLVCVSLGCTLAEDGVFAILMAVYMVLSLWCMSLFFLYRERSAHPSARPTEMPKWRQIVGWALPILAIGVVAFLTMPRSHAVWQVPKQQNRQESGISEEQELDLHHTGTLTLNPDIAFEVQVRNKNWQPKDDLPSDQRWRGPVYRVYVDGNWRRSNQVSPLRRRYDTVEFPPRLLDADQNQRSDRYFLDYSIKEKVGPIPFISDPYYMPPAESLKPGEYSLPVVTLIPDGTYGKWYMEYDGTLAPNPRQFNAEKGRYRQVTVPAPAQDLSHEIQSSYVDFRELRQSPDLKDLPEWTSKLLARLVNEKKLSHAAIEDRDPGTNYLSSSHHEEIARAITSYLATSPEFHYSLDLKQVDPKLDPTLDFLFNTKSGHCNRFASALALILRTLNIPTQVVLGYRGADSKGEGNYVVRQCYAHTWVEVLISRREPPLTPVSSPGPPRWYWLSLDPTPPDALDASSAATNRWWGPGLSFRKIYKNLFVNFSTDNRDEFFNDLWAAIEGLGQAIEREVTAGTTTGYLILAFFVLTILGSGLLLGRGARAVLRLWRKHRAKDPFSPQTEFYRRMLTILSKQGWKQAPHQTSREFADLVAQRLRARNDGTELSELIRRTASMFDRVRFGNEPMNELESSSIGSGLDRLANALSKS
jgi:transglutaminase-like putative cysteine protease